VRRNIYKLTDGHSLPSLRASVAATENRVAPLDVGLRKKLISLLNDVQCNGVGAFSTSVLVSAGAQLTLMNTWAASWSSARSKLEYYQNTGSVAKAQLASYNIDFGVSGDALGDGWAEVIQDADVIPLAALPLVPGTPPIITSLPSRVMC
jgi:hypothetical protein